MMAVANTFKWEFGTFYLVEAVMSCVRLAEPAAVRMMVTCLQDENGNPWDGMKVLTLMIGLQMTNSIVGHQMGY